MAASGYTPIQLYRTTTASAQPGAGNLADGELAINLTDEKLYFKNAGGSVTLLASSGGSTGSVTSVAASGGTTGLTFTGSPITTSGTLTLGGTLAVANGGTGTATAFTTGSVVFAGASGTYSQDNSNLFWDNTNNRLGVGNATPATPLDVTGTTTTTSLTEGVYSITGTTPALDPDNGGMQNWTLTGNSTPTDSFSTGQSMLLMINDGTAYTITWPTMTWIGGSAPTLDTSGLTTVELWKRGGVLYGALVGVA